MSVLSKALADTIDGQKLSYENAVEAAHAIIGFEPDDAPLVAALLAALQCRGLYAEILCAAVEVLQQHARPAPAPSDQLIDCCGTGGDVKFSFNISTAAGIIAASAGAKVSKHGNKSVSSSCGSADVLAEVGVRLQQCQDVFEHAVNDLGFGFLYAPSHHQVLARLAPVRRSLGVPTLFNLTGPLLNPSGANYQLLGTFSSANQQLLAASLKRLGRKRAWVVRAEDGMDELSIFCKNHIIDIEDNELRELIIDPADLGLALPPDAAEEITVKDPQSAAEMLWSALSDADSVGGKIARLNAAAVLCIGGIHKDLADAVAAAERAQRQGQSRATLQAYIDLFK